MILTLTQLSAQGNRQRQTLIASASMRHRSGGNACWRRKLNGKTGKPGSIISAHMKLRLSGRTRKL
jgi:hypothetical protein